MTLNGWNSVRFAEIADYKAGRTPSRARPDYWLVGCGGVPWIAISDMSEFGIIEETKERITESALQEVFRGEKVQAGTLIMSFKLTIGRVATLGVDACHNEAIIAIYPKQNVDQRYLGYFLSQVDYRTLQDRQVKGHTLNQSKLDRIEILLPPLEVQLQIADVLDLVRHSIRIEQSALGAVKDLGRSAARVLFSSGVRGNGQIDSEIGPMPHGWKLRRICELCEIWSGGTPRKSTTEFWSGDVPWVSGKDLKTPALDDAIDHISSKGLEHGSRLAPKDSVFVLVRGMGLAKDLPVAVINRPMAFNQDVKALVTRGGFSGRFLRTAISVGKKRLLSRVVPSAHGTMTLNLDDIESFAIPCPSDPSEAIEIVAIVDAIDREIALRRRKHAVLCDLFKSLLHKLMTGEINVADLDLSALTEPPSAGAIA